MNKTLLNLLFILISFLGISQEKVYWKRYVQDSTSEYKWANQINRLVGPKYAFVGSSYFETSIKGQELVIAEVYDTSKSFDSATKGIFIFQVKNSSLVTLGKPVEYKQDYGGPNILVKSDSLLMVDGLVNGGETLIYKFNSSLSEYLLSSIEKMEFVYRKGEFGKTGRFKGKEVNRIYEVNKKTLTIESEEYSDGIQDSTKSTKKVIHKKLPYNISLYLKDMKSPSSKEYDIFLDP